MMSIIIFLIILSALVIVHELGHFSVAKFFGIRVDEFGLGYPPKAKRLFRWRGTDFTLNWLPFGGFVKIFGENYSSEEPANSISSPSLRGLRRDMNLPDSSSENFQSKNRGIQAAVLFAGVFFNFLFAWVILTFLQSSLVDGLATTWYWTVETARALGVFIQGAILGQADLSVVTGPVGIVDIVRQAKSLGLETLLVLTALISVNLSIINLLPFPALDGGRLLFVGIEAITRKKIPARVSNALNTAGFAILLLLMILITFRDVRNLL